MSHVTPADSRCVSGVHKHRPFSSGCSGCFVAVQENLCEVDLKLDGFNFMWLYCSRNVGG